MPRQKYLIGLLLTVIFYFALVFIYKPFILSVCIKNGNLLIGDDLDLDTIIFCANILILLLMIANTKSNFKSYFLTIAQLIVLVSIGLIFQIQIIDYSTKLKLDSSLINQVSVDYRIFYLLPTILIFPPFIKQLISIINGRRLLHEFEFLSSIKLDIRVLRILSKLIDIVIVIAIAYFFSKVVVIYPDFLLMTLAGLYFYMFTAEYTIGTTIGKLIFGLKVISINNQNLSGFKILIRTISRLLPFYPLGILLGKNGLHDYISRTKVVKMNA